MLGIDRLIRMSWWEWVQSVARASGKHPGYDGRQIPGQQIALVVGIGQDVVNGWRTGTPKPESAARFARSYDRPVKEAFVTLGWMTPAEANQRPARMPNLSELSDDDLVEEIRRRIRGSGGRGKQKSSTAGGSVTDESVPPADEDEATGVAAHDTAATTRKGTKS